MFQSNHFENKRKNYLEPSRKDLVYIIVNKNRVIRYNSYQYSSE